MNKKNVFLTFNLVLLSITIFSPSHAMRVGLKNYSLQFNRSYSSSNNVFSSDIHSFVKYAKNYLQKNADDLACHKNESGFIRINIPVDNSLSNKIEKLRLNYWNPEAGLEILPESIHTHPRYFESFIIQGGYKHELYKLAKDGDEFAQYRILKDFQKKNFMFIGLAKLKFIEEVYLKKNSLIVFPKNLIHRVLYTEPLTLTLNTVFKNNNHLSQYDVFITKNGKVSDVKTEREMILNDETKKYTQEIVEAMKKFEQKELA